MKTLTSADVGRLASALYEAFPSVDAVDEMLHAERLGKRFDDLTSRALSLRNNCWEICSQAFDQGWALELLNVAAEAQPDNPHLRALLASLPDVEAIPTEAAGARSDRPSLVCGRAIQWNEVCQSALARQHQIIVVMGRAGRDPMHFRDRIQAWLATDPRRSIVVVQWLTRPASREAYFEDLATALRVDPPRLAETLAERIAVQNVVLLHDCVSVRFDDPTLTRYYTEWLPELIGGHPNASKLKCFQPIEWPAESGTGGLLRRLLAGGGNGATGRDGALGLVEAIRSRQNATMPVIMLDELLDLADPEIKQFLETSGLTPMQQQRMAERLQQVPQVPSTIFATIDASWNEVQTIQ